MLKEAFNMITRMHSRPATLKRFGTPNIFSPVRITPSNYFRFLEGPGSTVFHGREFIIPADSMKGHYTQKIDFETLPTQGGFHLTYGVTDTAPLFHNSTATDIQDALRDITGLEYVTVTGDFTNGFLVTFVGVETVTLLSFTTDAPPLQDITNTDVIVDIEFDNSASWSPKILRGDKIVDPVFGSIAVDEIIEMYDFGGEVMGYRCRAE